MAGRETATIYDVARIAGVSITTVSRYINTPAKVNQDTRNRIRQAMEELDYSPQSDARHRALKQFGRIGVVTPFFPDASFVQRLRGVSAALAGTPYEMIVYTVANQDQLEEYLITLPMTRRVDGLIFMSLALEPEQLKAVQAQGIPAVFVEFPLEGFSSVVCDNREGGRLAAGHLLSLGLKNLAVLSEQRPSGDDAHPFEQRLQGFREALEGQGLVLPEEHILKGAFSVEESRELTLALLDRSPEIQGFFAASDIQAVGVLKALKSRGLRVPQDVAVVGYDDIEAADYLELTTVSQSLTESGRIAAQLLLEELRHPGSEARTVQVRVTLKKRQTA